MSLTLESLKSDHSELYDQLRTEAMREFENDASDEERLREVERLQEENERLQAEQHRHEHRQQVARMLNEADLPTHLRSPLFESVCFEADEALLDSLLKLRREDAVLFTASGKPLSVEQREQHAHSSVRDGSSFAAAIR